MMLKKLSSNKCILSLMIVFVGYTVVLIVVLTDGRSKKVAIGKQIELTYLSRSLKKCNYSFQNFTNKVINKAGNQPLSN